VSAPVHEPDDAHQEEAELGKAYDARLMARLWPYVRPYWPMMLVTLVLVVPLFLLELAPAWIIKQGLDRAFPGESLADTAPVGPDWLVAFLEPPTGVPPLAWLSLLYGVAALALAGLQFLNLYVMAWTGQLAMRDLRRDIFDHIQSLHLGFFDKYPVGRLVTRATNDVENVAEMFSSGIVALVTDVFKMVGFATFLFLLNAELALWTFTVVPVLVLIAVVFRLRVREAFRETRVRIARINATIQETISGMKVVQLFTREARNAADFDVQNALNRDAAQRSNRWDAGLFSSVEIAQNLTVAIILGYGVKLATVGTFFVFVDWMRRFFMPLRDLSAKYSVMQSSMASAERIFQLFDTEPAVRDRTRTVHRGDPAARGSVEFENVWFAYTEGPDAEPKDEDWVLRDVSFRVAPGENVAFVGATGAGKTSVIKLLTRLYEPQRGVIRIDGVDLRDMPQAEIRRRVDMVLQDVFLFSGTVAENVSLGRVFATRHGYTIDANRELVGLGSANLVGAFFSSIPVSGSFSRSAVNDQTGAQTPLANWFTAGVIALTLLFLTPLFYYLPVPALAAIIIVARIGLIDVHELRAWRSGRIRHVDVHVVVPRYRDVDTLHALHEELGRVLHDADEGPADVVIHFDPCRPWLCDGCAVEGCPIRGAALRERPPLTVESATRRLQPPLEP